MSKNKNVEVLFDDIRVYIESLEVSLKNKEKEIEIRDKRISALEKNSVVVDIKSETNVESISLSKNIFSIKSIYYLLAQAIKINSTYEIKDLFNLLKKPELVTLSEKSNSLLISALCVYSTYSTENIDEKKCFIAGCVAKLNAEKLGGNERKIFNELIFTYKMYEFMDEDFLIKFIRKVVFTDNKDIAKSIVLGIIDSERVIVGDTNIQTLMFIGLHLGIEKCRKVEYMEALYMSAMDSRYDNLFINFLIGKLNLDYTQIEDNLSKIRVLNKNLVKYIYSVVSEKKSIKVEEHNNISMQVDTSKVKTSNSPKLLSEVRLEKKVVKTIIKKEKAPLKSIILNKNTRTCDSDGEGLKQIAEKLCYYNGSGKLIGEVKTHVLICKECKKKVINSDVIRKIYKELSIEYRIKFSNKKDIGLSAFKYNIGLPRSERFKLLKEVVCPAFGILNTIKEIENMIESCLGNREHDYKLSIIEWEYDVEKIKEFYKL